MVKNIFMVIGIEIRVLLSFLGYQFLEISIYKNPKHGSTIQRKLKIFHRKLTFKETQKGDYII